MWSSNESDFDDFFVAMAEPTSLDKFLSRTAVTCGGLGLICLLLNLYIVGALLWSRKKALRNPFYVLVFHCSTVDCVRGVCLIIWSLPFLRVLYERMVLSDDERRRRLLSGEGNDFAAVAKVVVYALVILRTSNLLTIFNLLVFTMNEYVVIKYPLRHRRMLRRRTILSILAASWVVCSLFGIISVSSFRYNIYVKKNRTGRIAMDDVRMRNDTRIFPLTAIINLVILCLCYASLAIVICCYGAVLAAIRKYLRTDVYGGFWPKMKRVPLTAKSSAAAAWSRMSKCGAKRTSTDEAPATTFDASSSRASPRLLRKAGSGGINYNSVIQQEQRPSVSFLLGRNLSNGSVLSGTAACSSSLRRLSNTVVRKFTVTFESRHKYLIVIGTVLFVDILFLLPYSGIQIVSIMNLIRANLGRVDQWTDMYGNISDNYNLTAFYYNKHLSRKGFHGTENVIKMLLQLLIGIHAVCQPLCYFRMHEFRRIACFRSHVATNSGGGTASPHHRAGPYATQTPRKISQAVTDSRKISRLTLGRSSSKGGSSTALLRKLTAGDALSTHMGLTQNMTPHRAASTVVLLSAPMDSHMKRHSASSTLIENRHPLSEKRRLSDFRFRTTEQSPKPSFYLGLPDGDESRGGSRKTSAIRSRDDLRCSVLHERTEEDKSSRSSSVQPSATAVIHVTRSLDEKVTIV